MLPKSVEKAITTFLSSHYPDEEIITHQVSGVSGGSINSAYRLATSRGSFFVKTNHASRYPDMFQKEAKGLALLRNAGALAVPEVLLAGDVGDESFLLLEYIEAATEKEDFWENFGESLAVMHSHHAQQFGLDHDNYMGSLRQHNDQHADWVTFFIDERLQRQVVLARDNGSMGRSDVAAFERLFVRLPEIFPPASPSLLHGDLWSGNFITGSHGYACLIDPAVYYGHPEIDIAMSTLFGGFSSRFYESYYSHNPLPGNYRERLPIYNLYPLLVHVNLFGGSYLSSVQQTLRRF
ncbi:MAG: ketosamine-3-kinase [Clostridia bacterium]|nr:ketosamine-3-kinase [Clostridia bacterium]